MTSRISGVTFFGRPGGGMHGRVLVSRKSGELVKLCWDQRGDTHRSHPGKCIEPRIELSKRWLQPSCQTSIVKCKSVNQKRSLWKTEKWRFLIQSRPNESDLEGRKKVMHQWGHYQWHLCIVWELMWSSQVDNSMSEFQEIQKRNHGTSQREDRNWILGREKKVNAHCANRFGNSWEWNWGNCLSRQRKLEEGNRSNGPDSEVIWEMKNGDPKLSCLDQLESSILLLCEQFILLVPVTHHTA
jgi:hypothetical protein